MTRLADLRCACGSADVIAVAPGHEPERVADLFVVERGVAVQAWSAACWPMARRAAA